MSDIVERLLSYGGRTESEMHEDREEAADEVKRLRTENAELKGALREAAERMKADHDAIDRIRRALATAHAEGMEEAADAVRDFCSAMGRIGEHSEADPSKVKASLDILEIAETIIRAKAKESKT